MTTTNLVEIRPAERADLLAVFRIERQSFPQPWPFSAFEQFLGEPGFLVATAGEAVIGYAVADVVTEHGRRLGHLKDLAVHPRRRGEGIGRRLLRRALTVLSVRDVSKVKLEVRESNDAAVGLYRSFGFRSAGRIIDYYDDGEDAVIMIVDLDRSTTVPDGNP